MQELRVESADKAPRKSSLKIHSQRMELHQAIHSSDSSRREKDWLYTELQERERALQETRVRTLQEMEDLKKFCCTEPERRQPVENRWLFTSRARKSIYSGSAYDSNPGITKQRELSEWFQGFLWSRVIVKCSAAILACSLTHRTCNLVHRETFLKAYLLETGHPQLSPRPRSLTDTHANLCLWTQEDLQPNRRNDKEILKTVQYPHRDLPGSFQLGLIPSGKTERCHCFHLKQGSCTKGGQCDVWHSPVCIHFKRYLERGCNMSFCSSRQRWNHKGTEDQRQQNRRHSCAIERHFYLPWWRRPYAQYFDSRAVMEHITQDPKGLEKPPHFWSDEAEFAMWSLTSSTSVETIWNPIGTWSGFLFFGHEFIKFISVNFPPYDPSERIAR